GHVHGAHQLEKLGPGPGPRPRGQHHVAGLFVTRGIDLGSLETKLGRQPDGLTGTILEQLGEAGFRHGVSWGGYIYGSLYWIVVNRKHRRGRMRPLPAMTPGGPCRPRGTAGGGWPGQAGHDGERLPGSSLPVTARGYRGSERGNCGL